MKSLIFIVLLCIVLLCAVSVEGRRKGRTFKRIFRGKKFRAPRLFRKKKFRARKPFRRVKKFKAKKRFRKVKKPRAAPTKVCWSTGDPHYQSFNGQRWDLYDVQGDFVLAKAGKFQVQTRIRYGRWWGTKGINSAVAVRYGSTFFEVYADHYEIDNKKNAPLNHKTGGLKISRNRNTWTIQTANGERVIINRGESRCAAGDKKKPCVSFHVYVHGHSTTQYSGLCDGNYSKSSSKWRVGSDSKFNLFTRRTRFYSPRVIKFRKLKWKSNAFRKRAIALCKKYTRGGRVYKNCVYDAKASGSLRAIKLYKYARKEIKKVSKRCVKWGIRCKKHCVKYFKKRSFKCKKYGKRCLFRRVCKKGKKVVSSKCVKFAKKNTCVRKVFKFTRRCTKFKRKCYKNCLKWSSRRKSWLNKIPKKFRARFKNIRKKVIKKFKKSKWFKNWTRRKKFRRFVKKRYGSKFAKRFKKGRKGRRKGRKFVKKFTKRFKKPVRKTFNPGVVVLNAPTQERDVFAEQTLAMVKQEMEATTQSVPTQARDVFEEQTLAMVKQEMEATTQQAAK